ncbi:MAG: hypothetical protein J2P18_10725, partial [Nocardia sp.]|nr:hypothetical protein [Nocardia sp.]
MSAQIHRYRGRGAAAPAEDPIGCAGVDLRGWLPEPGTGRELRWRRRELRWRRLELAAGLEVLRTGLEVRRSRVRRCDRELRPRWLVLRCCWRELWRRHMNFLPGMACA